MYWVQHQVYRPEEIAIRFKHRLVSIHCFPNGNGRHSRLMADLLLESVFKKNKPFSWGAVSLIKKGEARGAYCSKRDRKINFEKCIVSNGTITCRGYL